MAVIRPESAKKEMLTPPKMTEKKPLEKDTEMIKGLKGISTPSSSKAGPVSVEKKSVPAESKGAKEKAKEPPEPSPQAQIVNLDIAAEDLEEGENPPSRAPVVGFVAKEQDAGRLAKGRNETAGSAYTIDNRDMAALMQKEDSNETSEVFNVVEKMPEFPGGQDSLQSYLARNLHYPKQALAKGIQGRVFVTFIVEKDGSISEVRLLQGIGSGCDEEALRVIDMMPRWIPGQHRGKPVRARFVLPVKFTLDN